MQAIFPAPEIYAEPALLLQNLIRFDTSNPPGNEAACIAYIQKLLQEVAIPCTLLEKAPGRPNLIARLPGRGTAAPLLLQAHVDVVPTTDQAWTVAPFEGREQDGFIWGRGALDMKGGVAMFLSAFLRAKVEGAELPGDVILCILSDEERGGDCGAKFLVEEHPGLFDRVKYALGEFGGFTLQLGKQRYYPIQVAEKQWCHLRMHVKGPGGHGSMPIRGGAMAAIGAILQQLDRQPFPIRVTAALRHMVEGLASGQPFPAGMILRGLLNPALTEAILKILGDKGASFRPLVRNTVSPTIIRGGESVNVHPSRISLDLDCRLLPGVTPEQMIAELNPVAGTAAEFEVVRFDRGLSEPDMGLLDILGGVLRAADPTGIPVPMLLPAVTDGRFFARLGIQTYGFTPMTLPPSFSFQSLIHAADERIPVDAVRFGANAVYEVLKRFR